MNTLQSSDVAGEIFSLAFTGLSDAFRADFEVSGRVDSDEFFVRAPDGQTFRVSVTRVAAGDVPQDLFA